MSVLLAGHPAPLLVRGSEAATFLEAESDIVGVFSDASFQMREFQVGRGDRVYLYSDGLVELEPGREAEVDRLRAAAEQRARPDALRCGGSDEQRGRRDRVPTDDILLLGIEV